MGTVDITADRAPPFGAASFKNESGTYEKPENVSDGTRSRSKPPPGSPAAAEGVARRSACGTADC